MARKATVQITLTIPDPLIAELSREAEALGLTLSDHIICLLQERNASIVPSSGPLTGEELVEYWTREGIIGSRPDIADPIAFSRDLRDRNQNRRLPT